MAIAAKKLEAIDAAMASSDHQQALTLLDQLVADYPSVWAYAKRATVHRELGNEEAALADCVAGLEIDPEARNLQWMATELRKPAGTRFKGQFADPPPK